MSNRLAIDYFPVPIDDFLSESLLKFTIYIKISDDKFIKIAEAGTSIEKEKIEEYKSKSVKSLYITSDDYKKYLQLNIRLTRTLAMEPEYKIRSTKIIGSINSMLGDLVFKNLLDKETYSEAKDICVKTLQLASDAPTLIDILEAMKETSEKELFHATAVSFISCLIFKSLAWTYSANVHKLVFSSILHDVGKKWLSPELINKSPSVMSSNELKEYKKHVTTGRDLLLDVRLMSIDVIQAVYEHHETFNGTGFPNGLRGQQISPFARVLRIADDFCNLVYPKEGVKELSASEAVAVMISSKAAEYDPSILSAFKDAFKIS